MGERSDRPPARRIPPTGPMPAAGPASPGLIVVVGEWTGGLARALRAALRDTIDEYAVRLGVGVSTAGDWESNPAVVPHAVNQRALDELLQRTDDEQKRRFDLLTRGNRHVLVSDLARLNGNGVITHRRDATTAAAGLVTAFTPMEALERIAVQNEYPVDAGLVAAHEKFADALAELSATMRPDVLFDQVAQQADDLLGLLDRPAREVDRRRVETAAVSACAYAGMLAFNAGDRRFARRYFALARSVAEDSGDDTLRAQALGVGAILLSPMPGGGRGGDPRRQVRLLSEAVHHARRADPDTRASLHWWLATGLAGKRDELGFRRTVEAADRLTDQVGIRDGSGWLARHFAASGSQEQAKTLGEGLLLLRRPDPAVEAYAQALVGPRQGAWKVVVLVDTAAARVLQGEPESACAGLQEVIDLTKQVGYGMGVQRIRGVRAGFPPGWAGLACVRELDEQLRLAT